MDAPAAARRPVPHSPARPSDGGPLKLREGEGKQ